MTENPKPPNQIRDTNLGITQIALTSNLITHVRNLSGRDKSVYIPIAGLKTNQLGIRGQKIIIENPKPPNQI